MIYERHPVTLFTELNMKSLLLDHINVVSTVVYRQNRGLPRGQNLKIDEISQYTYH